ncbi:MAG: mechanosensitive ion channel family protein [Spirochaetaceae bacterium]|jgi:small-conductance mechanosensitive channel|nr:mechanosensitive ion channel family protein [Spirochaetaceae bacterium]
MKNVMLVLLLIWRVFVGLEAQETEEPEGLLEIIEEKIAEKAEAMEETEEKTVDGWFHLDMPGVHITIRLGITAAIILIQILLIRVVNYLFRKLQNKITVYGKKYIKTLTIKTYRLLETKQILNAIYFILRTLRYIIIALQLYLALPMIFRLFEPTKNLSNTLFGYILNPLKNTGLAIIKYIPNLITIAVIIVIFRYVTRSLRFFTEQIEKGKLVIPGFYPDWAEPTFNILRVLLIAFTVIVIYPYLPGSDSEVFKGVSVLMGILFSMGSSSIIGNLVAGIVLTYMRPFKLGDRIKIGDTVGFVVERSATITRLRTHKNEYITFPNSAILGSNITNYHTAAESDTDRGLILYTTITFGYSTPWQTVHAILIESALKAKYVEPDPMPFVLQTKLDDFYAHYEINVYTKAVDKVPAVFSELYKSIQNGFHEAGLDMTVAYFHANAVSYPEQRQPLSPLKRAELTDALEKLEKPAKPEPEKIPAKREEKSGKESDHKREIEQKSAKKGKRK